MNYPEFISIKRIVQENIYVKSVYIPFSKYIDPGQFLMITIPGVDEIPMSVSSITEDMISFTFKKVGDATGRLFEMRVGDIIGVRGPLGKGFKIDGDRILFVAGGTGISAVASAAERAKSLGKEIVTILGAKSKDELFFIDRLRSYGDLVITTDDGSLGKKGIVTDVVESILKEEDFDLIITCGPEIMMKKILDISLERGIRFQASLERYIKCGMGLCGQCCICKGLRVCKDGPVFDGNTLKNCEDFGVYRRDSSGRRVYLKYGQKD